VRVNATLVSPHGKAPRVNESYKELRRLIFDVDFRITDSRYLSGPVL